MKRPRKRLLTFNDPQPLRIDRRLAIEIGFLESVVLLQLEFLISISHNERDGQFWTYQTLQELKDTHFPWLSIATISRTIQNLIELELITRGNYNRSGFDRTQWLALQYEGIRQLKSVMIGEDAPILQNAKWTLQNEKSVSQIANSILHPEKTISHSEKSILQGETTIPKTTTETPTKIPLKQQQRRANTSRPPLEDTSPAETSVVVAPVATLIGELVTIGVTRRTAERLIAQYDEDIVRQQIQALPHRKCEDGAATLVKAIQENWEPPAAARKPLPRPRLRADPSAPIKPPAAPQEEDRQAMRAVLAEARKKTRIT